MRSPRPRCCSSAPTHHQHGDAVPIVLTFMLAASDVSLPEIVVLSRVPQPQLVLLFVGATLAVYTTLGLGFVWL